MARWQPPHPAKNITRDPGRCSWFDCRDEIPFMNDVALCFRHTNEMRLALMPGGRHAASDRAYGLAPTATLTDGWVYYLLVGDLIKIGFASDVRKRLRSYPPNTELLAVEPGDRALEKRRHQQFDEHLQRGREWFADVPEIRTWICTVCDEHGDPRLHTTSMTNVPQERAWRAEDEQRQVVGGKHIRNRRW